MHFPYGGHVTTVKASLRPLYPQSAARATHRYAQKKYSWGRFKTILIPFAKVAALYKNVVVPFPLSTAVSSFNPQIRV